MQRVSTHRGVDFTTRLDPCVGPTMGSAEGENPLKNGTLNQFHVAVSVFTLLFIIMSIDVNATEHNMSNIVFPF